MTDDRWLDGEADPAPEPVRHPVIPLAYQSSPAPDGAPLPAPEPSPVARAERERPDEPWGLLDLEEPPETYGVDELTVLPRDPWTLFCWWEATEAGIAAARAALGGEGTLVLRLHVSAPGTPAQVLDVDVGWHHGRRYLGTPRSGAWVASVLGLRAPDGRLAVIARAPRVAIPPDEPSPGPAEWMEVAPARSGGARREPPAAVRGTAPPMTAGAGLAPARPAPGSRTPSSPAGPGFGLPGVAPTPLAGAPTSPGGGRQ